MHDDPALWADAAFGLIKWHRAEIGNDDRTITIHYGVDFADGPEFDAQVTATSRETQVDVSLRLVPPQWSGVGLYSTWDAGRAPNRSIEVVLEEPVAGRPIIDAWMPLAPPPKPVAIHAVDLRVPDICDGRELLIDSVEIFTGSGSVEYRLRPGEREPDDEDSDEHWQILSWQLEIEDDVGTEYDAPGGAYGGDAQEIKGSRDFTPSPPAGASSLTLIVLDGRSPNTPEIARTTIAIDTGNS